MCWKRQNSYNKIDSISRDIVSSSLMVSLFRNYVENLRIYDLEVSISSLLQKEFWSAILYLGGLSENIFTTGNTHVLSYRYIYQHL